MVEWFNPKSSPRMIQMWVNIPYMEYTGKMFQNISTVDKLLNRVSVHVNFALPQKLCGGRSKDPCPCLLMIPAWVSLCYSQDIWTRSFMSYLSFPIFVNLEVGYAFFVNLTASDLPWLCPMFGFAHLLISRGSWRGTPWFSPKMWHGRVSWERATWWSPVRCGTWWNLVEPGQFPVLRLKLVNPMISRYIQWDMCFFKTMISGVGLGFGLFWVLPGQIHHVSNARIFTGATLGIADCFWP